MWFNKKVGGKVNTQGWMISYADMATILLAMFIVLSTLGKDQTGISFQNARDSLDNSRRSFGLSGMFCTSSTPIPLEGPTPHYAYDRPTDQAGKSPDGLPPKRVLDGDEEHLRRFVQEIQRQFPCERQPRPSGQVIVDLYEPLGREAPYLTAKHNDVLLQVVSLLERPNYRVELVVWAASPAATAWKRAVDQATLVRQEFADSAELGETARGGLLSSGQPWRYRDVRRPVLSLVLTKQE